MAFKDGGTVKKLAAGQGTVPGAAAPKNPSAASVGLGSFQVDLPPGPGTSTPKSGPLASPQGAGEGLDSGSPIALPEAPTSGASGGTAGFASPSGGGRPAYGRVASQRGSERATQGNSGGRAPLIRPVPAPPGNVPKGGPIIPKGAPNYTPPPSTSTLRPRRK